MELQTKSASVEIQTNSTPGEFTAVISAIGNIDRQGDRVMPGAFKSAIDADPIPPVYWAHMHHIPPIGSGYEWFEQGKDVVYKGALFVEGDDAHQYAQMVYAGMKARSDGRAPAINQFSYTYGVPDGGAEKVMEEGKSIRLLHEIRPVAEVGPCFIGANPDTYLVSPAKSAVGELVVARKRLGRVSMRDLLASELGVKDYGDIDGYEIRMLLDMLDAAVSFIQFSNEDDDTVKMQGVAQTLLSMLTDEFAEVTDLMAQGDAIDAILNPEAPNVTVSVDVETASAEPEKAKLAKKSDDAAGESEEKPAGESTDAAGESETTEEKEPEVAASEEEAAPAAESNDTEETVEEEDEDEVSKSDNSMSSDDASTVSNDEIARLVNTWPSH
jgi:hypothetical protein